MVFPRLLAVAALAFFALACSESAGSPPSGGGSVDVDFVKGDVILGDATAPVEIIEYASTTCGHCRTFHKTILPSIKSEFVETGKAKFIFRDLPTAPAPVSAAGGALARCAGSEGYYATLDDIFTNQYELLQASQSGGALNELIKIGERNGLSAETTKACVQNPTVIAEITRTSDLADQDDVRSTPTVFINGQRVARDAMTVEGLSSLIRKATGEAEPASDEEPAAAE